jgi:hypothetical protein
MLGCAVMSDDRRPIVVEHGPGCFSLLLLIAFAWWSFSSIRGLQAQVAKSGAEIERLRNRIELLHSGHP